MKSNIKFTYEELFSMGSYDSPNILIKGDNKDILPELIKEYRGKIKCVYIDPPYNNGDSYHYYKDNVSEASWLKSICDVLVCLKMLLMKNGSVWISIDDSEMAYLRVAADKVFGRENFAGTIVWQQRKSRENRTVFSCNHEYILVYTKDIKLFKKSRNLLPVSDNFVDNKYKNPDNDPRGPWQSVSASVQAGHAVKSQFYTIVAPSGKEFYPPKGRCWVYNEDRMKREIEQGNVWFGLRGENVPRIKKFLSTAKIGLTPETLWTGDEYGTTDMAKKHLLSLFPEQENVFDTPKPEELIKHIFEISTNEGELVLDCYLGSGTTVAVAHKLKRRYIGIEIGNQMTNLVVNRLRSVIAGEQGGISKKVDWQGGGSFAFYSFDKTKREEKLKENDLLLNNVQPRYKQLNLFDLYEQYGDSPIVENDRVKEELFKYEKKESQGSINIDSSQNVLICNVKKDNCIQYLDRTAKIYYSGRKFPSTIDLNKLYYFMPYIKNKGIRDLYIIKIARIGKRKEGQNNEDPNDLRLVFEIEYVGELYNIYKPIRLDIWRTFKNTTIGELNNCISNGC